MHTQNGVRPREGINALHYYWTNPLHHLQPCYTIAVSLDLYAGSFVEEYVECSLRGREVGRLLGHSKERDCSGDLGIDGRVIIPLSDPRQ